MARLTYSRVEEDWSNSEGVVDGAAAHFEVAVHDVPSGAVPHLHVNPQLPRP
jgi:hypothetical protein